MMRNNLENFLEKLKLSVAQTTFVRQKWQLEHFIKYLNEHDIFYTDVNKQTIEEYLLSLAITTMVRQQHCTIIKRFYSFCEINPNPAEDIFFKKDKAKKLFIVPTQKKIETLIRKLNDGTEMGLRNRLIVELAYGSGLRAMELVTLNIEDVNLEEMTVYVLGKGNKNRIIPITDQTARALREYLPVRMASRGPLFVSLKRKRRICKALIYNTIKNNSGFNPHKLRHACATHMLQNGCSTRIIQELLGHNSLTSTQIYTNLNKKDLRDVLENKHPRSKS